MGKISIASTGVSTKTKFLRSDNNFDTYATTNIAGYELLSLVCDGAQNWVCCQRNAASSNSVVQYSHDGGLTWNEYSIYSVIGVHRDVVDIATDGAGTWVAVTTAYAGEYALIVKSTDNGESWSIVHTCSESGYYRGAYGVAYGNGVWLVSCGYSLYRSTDGASSWSIIYTKNYVDFRKIATDGAGVWCVAVETGDYLDEGLDAWPGQIYRSTDDGANWSKVYQATGLHFFYSIATDENGVWCAGCNGDYDEGYIFRSSDNGANWTLVYTHPAGNYMYSVATDKNGVWLGACSAYDDALLVRSLDNGINWSVILTGSSIANAVNGVAFGSTTCPLPEVHVGSVNFE